MKKCTAFVLSGGGSRGALQVGAMRALIEVGIVPDLLVGASIGAVNSAGLARWGVNLNGLDTLEKAWREIADKQILDPRISQLIVRLVMGYPSDHTRKRIEDYFTSIGFDPGLRFDMIPGVRLALVSADIETGQPVVYGLDQSDSVLEGLMASIALPPWFMPFQKNGHLMVDGGALSNLPIESALRLGATEIIALDLDDISMLPKDNLNLSQYLEKYIYAVSQRCASLEKALAETQSVPVHCIDFQGLAKRPTWDFRDVHELIRSGYEKARAEIAEWEKDARPDNVIFLRDADQIVLKHIRKPLPVPSTAIIAGLGME